MFVIRQQQLDAFRLPRREQLRQQAMAQLRGEGLDVSEQPDSRSLVCRDERGAATTLTYSDRLLLQTIEKPLGQRYELAHDADGRLTQMQYPTGEQLRLGRDANGLLTRLQTAPNSVFTLGYHNHRLNHIAYPDGATRRFGYDANGLLSSLTDRTGQTRQYIRNKLDGKLLAVVDELGYATRFAFDNGDLAGIIFPDDSRQTVVYDEADNSLLVTLRDGKKFIQQYEGEHLRELNWEDGPWTRFTHDANGRPQTIQTPNSLVSFGYSSRGLAHEQGSLGTSHLHYDATGQLAQLALPMGLQVSYEYDSNDRLRTLVVGGQSIVYEYGAGDLLTGIAFPNGLRQSLTNRHLGGVQHTQLTNEYGRVLHEEHYDYDVQQRLTALTNELTHETRQLHYDAEDRLLALTNGPYQERFRYNAVGSLTQLNGQPVETGPMGEIRAIGPDRWRYDALGNATRLRGPQGMLDLDFARNGTLSRLQVNGQVWQYTYDGLGRRTGKTNGDERWQYGWLEGRLVTESYQATAQSQPVLRQYVYHPDSFTPVAFVEAGQLFIMQADVRGAVTDVYDPQGRLVWQAQYTAYGSCRIVVGQIRQDFRLAGQWADSESGLYYNLSRYYAPFAASYLSLDPRWLDTLDNHPYAYARANPFGRHDPLGDFAPLLVIGGAALVGGVISGGITAWQGGSWRQIGASFAHGALSGAGAAAGAMLGGVPGMMAGAAAGGFLGSLAEQAINGEELCWGCALESALVEGLFAGALGLAGKVLGPVLGRLGRALASSRIGQAIGRAAGRAGAAIRNGINGLRQRLRPGRAGPAPLRPGQLPPNATNAQKGVFGEHVSDIHMANRGHTKLNDGGAMTPVNGQARGTGIDGVWRNATPPPEYIITEAKYGTSRLGQTADGQQMSDTWVLGSNRLENAVGQQEANRIRRAMASGRVRKEIHQVDANGNVTVTVMP